MINQGQTVTITLCTTDTGLTGEALLGKVLTACKAQGLNLTIKTEMTHDGQFASVDLYNQGAAFDGSILTSIVEEVDSGGTVGATGVIGQIEQGAKSVLTTLGVYGQAASDTAGDVADTVSDMESGSSLNDLNGLAKKALVGLALILGILIVVEVVKLT